ncbi:DNA polymerase III PolC-type-like [Saccostrea cucullata]|uniref:DNA polymerase III PolC-type-like n=1 Tax=Saccostrea cuccullata TaxID=36930 RepID=UPI002ED6174F
MKKIDSQKSQESSEIREGTTYKTCVDLNNNEGDMENITEIPPPLRKPQSTPIVHDQCTFVYFDLETTGLGKDCEVTQIGAYASEKSFSQYILPSTQPISPSATAVSGIAVKENIMFKNGVQVPCKNAKDGIETFITWLKNFSNIVLVAHNAKFDSNVIIRAMHQVGLRPSDFIIGFVDTLPLFREAVPNRKSYKQVDLMKDLCTAQYDAHDALADSEALQRLVLHLDISRAMMLKHSFSVDFVIENDKYAILLSRNASSLKHLVDENILSKFTANKIAASGLHYDHLCIAHHRDPVNGIKSILSEKNMGKVRVTSNGKIIKSLHQYFMKGN